MDMLIVNDVNESSYGHRMCRGESCLSAESLALIKSVEESLSVKYGRSPENIVSYLKGMVLSFVSALGTSDPAILTPLLRSVVDAGPKRDVLITTLEKFATRNQRKPALLKALLDISRQSGAEALWALRRILTDKPDLLLNRAVARELTALFQNVPDQASWEVVSAYLNNPNIELDYGRIRTFALGLEGIREKYSPAVLRIMAQGLATGADGITVQEMAGRNINYALNKLGEEKTITLNTRFDIVYFGRYSEGTLRQLIADIDSPESRNKPVLLMLVNKNDHNGVFYRFDDMLDDVREHYRLAIFETEFDSPTGRLPSQLSDSTITRRVAREYGKIAAKIYSGHGNEESIRVGTNNDHGKISLFDRPELAQLKDCFIDHPTVILNSCSTGKGPNSIAAMFQQIWQAKVFAPEEDSTGLKLSYQNGQLFAKHSGFHPWQAWFLWNITRIFPIPEESAA